MLQNHSIITPDNLAINFNVPLLRYESPGDILGEAMSGSVYRTAYERFITIQWINRTSVTGNDRCSLKPYMLLPEIYTESFRQTFKAWGYHGFLPKCETEQNQGKKLGVNICNYHAELCAVLETFCSANDHLCNITLPLAPDKSMTVDIVT